MNSVTFAEWIKQRNLKPDDAAIVLGVSRAMIYRYLNDSNDVPLTISNQCNLIDLLAESFRAEYLRHQLSRK